MEGFTSVGVSVQELASLLQGANHNYSFSLLGFIERHLSTMSEEEPEPGAKKKYLHISVLRTIYLI